MTDEQAPEPTPVPDMFQDVLDFTMKFVPNQIAKLPVWPAYNVMNLRGKLIKEEIEELTKAFEAADFEGIVDNTLDLVYVLLGLLIAMGVDARPVWNEIQRANMAKTNGGLREDGKVLKPKGWIPPDITGVLMRQQPIQVVDVSPADVQSD